ncbi:MAG: hypothetical protein VB933_04305 [Pseudomonadales bacterium]
MAIHQDIAGMHCLRVYAFTLWILFFVDINLSGLRVVKCHKGKNFSD